MSPIREKRHRLPRESYVGEVLVSITACIDGRVPLFEDPVVVAAFVEILDDVAGHWGCRVLVYCFMPDHLHLVVHGDAPTADVWRMMVEFKQRSGYWLRQRRRGVGWQKDFHDHVLRRGDDVVAQVRYILDNPCRKGLVADWAEYPMKGSIGCRLEDVVVGLPL